METSRLILRRFMAGDFNDFRELIRDKMHSEYAVYDAQYPTDDESLRGILSYFAGSEEFFAVELKPGSKVIGLIALNRIDGETSNLGYCVHGAYQGNGYAGEAVARILEYARNDLKLRRLVSGTAETNTPSVRLLKSAGFVMTGKSVASFTADENGAPIEFTGCSFECIL